MSNTIQKRSAVRAHGAKIGIDFETFFSTKDKYSLRNMTAEEYINSTLFEIIMVSIKIGDAPAYVVDGSNREELAEHLRSLPWDTSVAYAHNGAFFDFLILGWVFGIFPAFYMDTLLMARPIAGTGDANTLAALAERYGLPSKLDTIYAMDGIRRAEMSDEQYAAYAEYCTHDIDLANDLLPHLIGQWRSYDLAWMDITMRMAAQPVFRLDPAIIAEGLEKEDEREGQQLYALHEAMEDRAIAIPQEAWDKVKRAKPEKKLLAALKKAVGSADMFAGIMNEFGIEPPEKWSDKQKKWVYAFARSDGEFMDLADTEIDGARELVEARLGVKSTIMHSRLTRLAGIARRMGVLPVPIMPFAAHTGRNGGTMKVNVQNFSSRPGPSNPYGKANPCRRTIHAPDDHLIYDADLSQIEVRVLGGVTGEPNILVPFADSKNCPYCAAGPLILGKEVIKGVHKTERNILKAAILGNGYGQGGPGFQGYAKRSGIILDLTESQRIVDAYRRANPLVCDFWDACEWALDKIMTGGSGHFGHNACLRVEGESIILPSGRPIRYRGLRWSQRPDRRTGRMKRVRLFYDPVKRSAREVYGSLTTENIVQGIAADVVHEMGVDLLWRFDLAARLQVHDSLVFVEPTRRHDYILDALPQVMQQPRPWMDWIPLGYEVEVGKTYGDLEEVQ